MFIVMHIFKYNQEVPHRIVCVCMFSQICTIMWNVLVQKIEIFLKIQKRE